MANFSTELIKLADTIIDEKEKSILLAIIDLLQSDLLSGHSCSNLAVVSNKLNQSSDQIRKLLLDSGLAAPMNLDNKTGGSPVIPAKPIVIFHNLVYLNRYFYYEYRVATKISQLGKVYPDSDKALSILEQLGAIRNTHKLPNQAQFAAIQNCISRQLSIITGGPGTGKTTTVTLLLWALSNLYYNDKLNVKICAPTGKAANRVKESIMNSLEFFKRHELPLECDLFTMLFANSSSFTTIHKLLGYRQNSIYFRHNETNSLDVDILIVDESSMIGLSLFSKLLSAIDPLKTRHIIFLGDRNQLSSVEEGYVFASLVKSESLCHYESPKAKAQLLQPELFQIDDIASGKNQQLVSELLVSNRSNGEISKLSLAILCGNLDLVYDLLAEGSQTSLRPLNMSELMSELFKTGDCWDRYGNFLQENAATKIDISEVFLAFNQQVVLSATNNGFFGVNNLNLLIEKRIKHKLSINEEWYTGRPIMILSNDYALGLFNGDIGICQICDSQKIVVFPDGRSFIPEILPRYQLAYAITIHKSQGSEYNNVNIVLPDIKQLEEIYSRELIYTAVTRAKHRVTIFSSKTNLDRSILNQLERNTGLQLMLQSQI
ncbi:exodeoxyribonuclease V subunit alpha [Aquella oligotrophica]|uniref:RecBCD enzyme subunit RecD n=1 Tax=Aquella oligotrophica TaxID=2067065 RepID=A0A2I7N3Z8_9NEIS|nr:exodeoxyribonuclease V subunit alpha [Aquella oligotrophica]AUR51200.1 exodeoxyribonuclease V subunit alpha [Aquella oligotrophica]